MRLCIKGRHRSRRDGQGVLDQAEEAQEEMRREK